MRPGESARSRFGNVRPEEGRALRRGAKRLAATVPEQNADALHFFRENGFVLKEHTMDGAYLEMDIEVRPLP